MTSYFFLLWHVRCIVSLFGFWLIILTLILVFLFVCFLLLWLIVYQLYQEMYSRFFTIHFVCNWFEILINFITLWVSVKIDVVTTALFWLVSNSCWDQSSMIAACVRQRNRSSGTLLKDFVLSRPWKSLTSRAWRINALIRDFWWQLLYLRHRLFLFLQVCL